jgi:hypothetical protein
VARVVFFDGTPPARGDVAVSHASVSAVASAAAFLSARGGHSGYPISSGRVIRVLRNSGNENHYPISALEKHYPQIRVPAKIRFGFGFELPNLPEMYNQSIQSNTHNFA